MNPFAQLLKNVLLPASPLAPFLLQKAVTAKPGSKIATAAQSFLGKRKKWAPPTTPATDLGDAAGPLALFTIRRPNPVGVEDLKFL